MERDISATNKMYTDTLYDVFLSYIHVCMTVPLRWSRGHKHDCRLWNPGCCLPLGNFSGSARSLHVKLLVPSVIRRSVTVRGPKV